MKKTYTNDSFRALVFANDTWIDLYWSGYLGLATPVEFFITLPLLFGFAFIVTGILEVIHAILSRHYIPNWAWLMGGILLVSRPLASTIIFRFIGFGIMFGRLYQSLGRLSLKNWVRSIGVGC